LNYWNKFKQKLNKFISYCYNDSITINVSSIIYGVGCGAIGFMVYGGMFIFGEIVGCCAGYYIYIKKKEKYRYNKSQVIIHEPLYKKNNWFDFKINCFSNCFNFKKNHSEKKKLNKYNSYSNILLRTTTIITIGGRLNWNWLYYVKKYVIDG